MMDMSNDSHLFRTREQLEADGWRLVRRVARESDPGNGPSGSTG